MGGRTTTAATMAMMFAIRHGGVTAFLAPLPNHRRAFLPSVASFSRGDNGSASGRRLSAAAHLETSSIQSSSAASSSPRKKEEEEVENDNALLVLPEREAALAVAEIMSLLERNYPEEEEERTDDDDTKRQRWIKTRKYLYQYCASARGKKEKEEDPIATAADTAAATDRDSETTTTKRKRRRRRRNGRDPLTLSDLESLLSFLRTTFPDRPDLQSRVLQRTPRILGQCHSIESRLVPTVQFLQGLYGGMASGNNGGKEEGGMFFEAISRNTDLLLVRGVGYAGSRGGKSNNVNEKGEEEDDCGDNTLAVEEYLQSELGVSSSGIAKLKRNHPTLFQLSLNDKVKPVVRYLYSLIGHGATTAAAAAAAATAPPPTAKKKKQVAKMVTNHPMLLQLDVASNLEPTANFLRDSCDLDDKELAAIVAVTPGVLGLSIEGNLRPTMRFLGDVLESCSGDGGGSGGTKDLLRKYEDDGRGDTDGEGGGEASKESLRKCILKHPQILALSLNNLIVKRDYFDDIDEMDNDSRSASDDDGGDGNDENVEGGKKPSLAARILVSAPSAYSLSLEGNIVPKVEYLGGLWGCAMPASHSEEGGGDAVAVGTAGGGSNNGDGDNSLADNLREYPQILTLSMEGNIVPTLSFYNMTGYVDLDARGLPMERPPKSTIRSRYIASSLYNRLLPRWHFLQGEREKQRLLEQRAESGTVVVGADDDDRRPPLHLLAGASDETFCRHVNLPRGDYLAFKEEAAPRLKFSSQFDRWLRTGRPIDPVASGTEESKG